MQREWWTVGKVSPHALARFRYHSQTMSEERQTKSERREEKRRKDRKMGVSGRSVRQLQEIIRRKAEQAGDEKK